MQIFSEVMKDPSKRARLRELISGAVASKGEIVAQRENIRHLRQGARDDIQVRAKDFNAEVKKYL